MVHHKHFESFVKTFEVFIKKKLKNWLDLQYGTSQTF